MCSVSVAMWLSHVAFFVAASAERAIQLGVVAEWPVHADDKVAEISEFLADMSVASFWAFIDSRCQQFSTGDPIQGNAWAMSLSKSLTPRSAHYLMETSIGLGTYAPTIRFFDTMSVEYGNPCDGEAFAVTFPGATVHCRSNVSADSSLHFEESGRLDVAGAGIAPWDHSYRPLLTSKRHVVLYGSIGSASFCRLHRLIVTSLGKGSFRYSVRHSFAGSNRTGDVRSLQGYGVHLDIKNMEYKNVDDGKGQEDGDATSTKEALFPDQEIKGVNFNRLFVRHPDLADGLSRAYELFVRMEQEEIRKGGTVSGSDTMKAWKIADLGHQTVLSIITSDDPVWRMEQLLHNFPSHANSLSNMKVTAEAKQIFSDLHMNGIANALPFNSILVNGLPLDLGDATFDVYDLLEKIKEEYKRFNFMHGFGISDYAKSAIMKGVAKVSSAIDSKTGAAGSARAAPPEMSTIVRVDVSKGGKNVVQFVNNLEKDSMYMHNGFSRTVKMLLQPSWSLHMIAKNLYTLVAVIDLTTPNGRTLLANIQSIYGRQYPIRLGIVLACSEKDDVSIGNENRAMPVTASDITRLFEYVKSFTDLTTAVQMIFQLSTTLQDYFLDTFSDNDLGEYTLTADGSFVRNPTFSGRSDGLMSRAEVVAFVENYISSVSEPPSDLVDVLYDVAMGSNGVRKNYVDLVAETREYLEQRGLPLNSFSFNGIVVERSEVDSELMSLLGREQYFLGSMVQNGQVTDRTRSIFNVILKNSKTYTRYHPMLNMIKPTFVSPSNSPFSTLVSHSHFLESPFMSPMRGDKNAIVSTIASDSALLIFPLTKVGVQSAMSSIDWILGRNISKGPRRGARIAFVPLVEDDIQFNEASLLHGLDELMTLSATASSEESQLAVISYVKEYLRCLETANEGSVHDFLDKFVSSIKRDAAFPDLVESINTVLKRVLSHNTENARDVSITRHQLALATIGSIETLLLNEKSSDLAVDSDTDEECNARNVPACKKGIFMVLNGGVIKARSGEAIHPLDFEMFSDILSDIFTEPFLSALDFPLHNLMSPNKENYSGRALQDILDSVFITMSAYCGSIAVNSPARIDVHKTMTDAGLYRKTVAGVARYFPSLQSEPASYVSPAELFSVNLTPPRAIEGGTADPVAISVVVNPLSQAGQRAAALVRLCLDHLQMPVHLVLIPPFEVTEFPIKNYYRFVANPTPLGDGLEIAKTTKAVALFRHMPRSQIFTVRMDVPEAWNVQATISSQDIDNLVCGSRSCGDSPLSELSSVTYTLKNLLVTGQCYEQGSSLRDLSPPNGLQLTLDAVKMSNLHLFPVDSKSGSSVQMGTDSRIHSDTLVMQNLGYFQLQADAGLYFLQLANGKARHLFTLENETALFGADGDVTVESGSEYEEDDEFGQNNFPLARAPPVGIQVAVKSFTESVIQLKVHKRPGMENIPLLEDPDRKPSKSIRRKRDKEVSGSGGDEKVDSMWNSISSMFGRQEVKTADSNETIHVFSLATGHVYERLLRIMMLSVSKRTKSPLKFWLFENYLSPTFKLLASEMAKKYGFEIGYVTYKWPKWLTEQTEKQRIIWGCKILFLDVLFPLNVKKVIYVDADQTVRADLKELWDMDLHGKPYGYVPFCTSRKETLGYQFWRSGYWENHLAGKPYHISALYVVDLTVFRRYAVGDRLRAVYDQLARDPNSLANLDQDLPNFAQHTVPIHSLPQEWLWCETWCSDSSKKNAKTIDLCNNPDKKEPKLDMARRIISGPLFKESWVELDEEIRILELETGFNRSLAE